MTDPASAFSLLFTPAVMKDVLKYTNIEGKRALQDKWCETDEIEIIAFIVILIHLGALKQNISQQN